MQIHLLYYMYIICMIALCWILAVDELCKRRVPVAPQTAARPARLRPDGSQPQVLGPQLQSLRHARVHQVALRHLLSIQ